ncbi:hypothetical protein [Tuanshanicoccus yangjingiae]|uniref:hypothetical protein n=1 Tax=Aerococcaceae bacterium zg-252 TaxID=2796928 RepID=UPI004063B72B
MKDTPQPQYALEQTEQNGLNYRIVGPKNWSGKLLNWLINDVQIQPFDLDVNKLNDYLDQVNADYRVQVILLPLGMNTVKAGENYDTLAQQIMEEKKIDLIHMGYYFQALEYHRPIIQSLMNQQQLIDVTNQSYWSRDLLGQTSLFGLGEPDINIVGLFVPDTLTERINQDKLVNWVMKSSEKVNLQVPALQLFFNEGLFEKIFVNENGEWQYWWRTEQYQALKQLNWSNQSDSEKISLINLHDLDDWSKEHAIYHGQKGKFIELGINLDLHLAQSYDELETGIVTNTEFLEESRDFIFRLYNDADFVRFICDNQFKSSISNQSFFNQWLMYDETMNDRLEALFSKKILFPTADINMQMIHQLQSELSRATIYQKLLHFEQIEESELISFEEKMNALGLKDILQKLNAE